MKFSSAPHPWPWVVAAGLALSACGGDGDVGTLRVSMTDAPACGFDSVFVTVERVRVHSDANADPSAFGWRDIIVNPAQRIDLLSLNNGTLQTLGQTALPAGRYTQMRLVLSDTGNTVTPTGGAETALDTPSGQQSGLKINLNVDVQADEIADVAIDFDACKSIVPRGSTGRFNLKPVLTAIPIVSSAGMRIVGHVPTGMAGAQTAVSAQVNGVPVRSTPPDPTTGRFVLYPVPAGTYDLVVTSTGRVNAVMTGVPVTTSAITTIGSETVRIDPPASSTQRTASGIATATGGVPSGTLVHALQTVSGTTIEAAAQPANATIGTYSLTLPIEAPAKAAYSANPTAITFTADNTAAGRYRLEARAEGQTTQAATIDLTSANATANFVFP